MLSVGDLKERYWTHPPPPPAGPIFIQFRAGLGKMAKLIGLSHLWGWHPGKFWIRHWLCHMFWSFTNIHSVRMDPGFRRINHLDPTFPCFYRPQRSWGKVIFSQASVILFTRGGVCLSACWDTTPGKETPLARSPLPGKETPLARQTPPWQGDAPLARQTPLHSACWKIQSTSGRYASYWNAILVGSVTANVKWTPQNFHCIVELMVFVNSKDLNTCDTKQLKWLNFLLKF